VSDLCIKF